MTHAVLARPGQRGASVEAPATEERSLERLSVAGRALHALVRGEQAPPELFAPGFRHLGPGRDLFDASSRVAGGERRRWDDVTLEIRRFVSRDDKVIAYVRFVGRRLSEDAWRVTREADGYISFRFAGTRILEQWSVLRWR